MACDLSGVGLIDPELLFREVYATATYTDRWHRLANSFRSPVGRGHGTAKLLIRQTDYARLTTRQTDLTLTFRDGDRRSFRLPKLSVLTTENVLPSDGRGTASVLLLTLVDRRYRYQQVPAGRQYNYRDSETGDIITASQDGGVDWTWQGVVDDLWTKLRAVFSDLPATGPQFPSAPSGTPEGFEFTATDCWTALCDVAFAGGYLLKYDPTLDQTTIIDPAAVAPPEGAAVYARQWDSAAVVDADGPLPESVTVSFPRPGRSDRFLETVAITGGGPAGTEVLVRNEMPAVEDPVSNTTAITQRAGFVAAQWRRDWYAASEQRAVEYTGCEDWCRRAVGYDSYAEWAVYDLGALDPALNLNGGLTTAIASGPLLVQADGLMGSGVGAAGADSFLALLIAEDPGPPVRYQYRAVTTPNDAGDAAANTTYDMVLGSTTGYAYEIDNRKCTVVSDPGAGTYTGDPWLVSIVRVYTIGADKYFQIDQTAQDDKPGWVSPVSTGQQWYHRKASRWYTHATFKFENPAYTSAQHASLDGVYFGYSENDGRVNTNGAISPTPSLTQTGVLKYTGTAYNLAEITDRLTHWIYPKWLLTDISDPNNPVFLSTGVGVAVETGTDGTPESGRHTYVLDGLVSVSGTVVDGDGRYSDGAGISSLGPSRFHAEAGGTNRDTGPALICGNDTGAEGESAKTITYAASRNTFDMTGGDSPPITTWETPSGLPWGKAYQCTTDIILRSADDVAEAVGTQTLRFGVVRVGADDRSYTLMGADEDWTFNVFYPASPFHAAYYIRHTAFFRGGLFIGKKSEVFAGEPDPPTIPPV